MFNSLRFVVPHVQYLEDIIVPILKKIMLIVLVSPHLSSSRYIMSEQKKAEEFGITEDDVSEIRQDINKFRFELVEILRKNRFDIGTAGRDNFSGGRRAKQMERRILKGFNVDIHDLVKDAFSKQDTSKTVDIFKVMAEAINKNSKSNQINAELNHIKFSNEDSLDYSSTTIAAAKQFKRSLANKKSAPETNGRPTSGVKQNGPTSDYSVTSPVSRSLLANHVSTTSPPSLTSAAAKQLNVQMLKAAVIPCTITVNVPRASEEEEEEEEGGTTKELRRSSETLLLSEAGLKQRLLERTSVRSLGGSQGSLETIDPEGRCSKLTSVRRTNQVTSGWI